MCKDCFEQFVYKFNSQTEFESWEKAIDAKVLNHNIDSLAGYEHPSLISQPDMLYKCNTCHEFWLLAIPDNAWRGYFIPEQAVADYLMIKNKAGRKRQQGCIVFIIASIVILVILNKMLF